MKIEVKDLSELRDLQIPAAIKGERLLLLPMNSTVVTEFIDWVQVPELRHPILIDLKEWVRK